MKVPVAEAPEGLKKLVNQFSDDYEVYVSEEIQMEGDPTSFEEAMRSVYSFEWQEAMEVEMNSIIPTMFGTQKKFLMKPKQQAVKGSIRQNMTQKGM